MGSKTTERDMCSEPNNDVVTRVLRMRKAGVNIDKECYKAEQIRCELHHVYGNQKPPNVVQATCYAMVRR